MLTSEEIVELAKEISKAQQLMTPHVCRLSRITEKDIEEVVRIHHEVDPDQLKAALKFYKNFDRALSDTGRTFRNLIITLGFGTAVSLIILGVYSKIQEKLNL